MRGARSYLITTGYVSVVGLFVLVVYSRLSMVDDPSQVNQQAAQMGRAIWTWGCIAQALLVPFMVPAFTCGAITQERERDMLELLLLTQQSPIQICAGKLGSGVGLGMLLILASVPVLSLSFVLGGVTPLEVTTSIGVLLAAVLASGALGLAVSSLVSRTATASTATYGAVGTVMAGLPALQYLNGGSQGVVGGDSVIGLVALLAVYMALTFVPAVGLTLVMLRTARRRTGRDADRKTWLLVGGLTWCALLATMYLPGADALFDSTWVTMRLHPVSVILDIMHEQGPVTLGVGGPPSVWSALTTYPWMASMLVSLLIAVWSFHIAVLRVRSFRMG